MTRVLLVDDHPVVRAGLRTVLDSDDSIRVVGEAGSAAEALAAVAAHDPDVMVLDMHLGPGASGLDVLGELQGRDRPRVLVMTVFDNDHDTDAALASGAVGYVLKDAPEGDVVRAVHAAAAGQHFLDPRIAARLVTRTYPAPDAPSARELEVLAAAAEGHDNATIARRLFISQATVKSHLSSVFAKLDVTSRTGAIAEARRRGHLR